MSGQNLRTSIAKRLPEGVVSLLQLLTRKGRLKRKVKARKRALAASPFTYTDTPSVSLVIQSFNHRHNIERLVGRLRKTVAEELIACEDGSVDGSEKEWRRQLTRPNDFLIQSNDLHEIRTYNRAISLARGEIVGVLQDDDIPPADPRWLSDALALFAKYKQLAILGCWNSWTFDFETSAKSFGKAVGPGATCDTCHLSLIDPELKVPFQFVDAVGIGPMFFRKADFQALGGFDLKLSRPGEPGIWLDFDICLRAWLSGRQVGAYESEPFQRGVGGQGTIMFANQQRSEGFKRNWKYVQEACASRIGGIQSTVSDLNARLARRPAGGEGSKASTTGARVPNVANVT